MIRVRVRATAFAATFLAAALAAGCGSSSRGGGEASSGPLTIATFNPFSGPNSFFGPNEIAGCFAAARLIDAGGGILGHKTLRCQAVDSRGDPADAVPAARQLVATSSNLVGLLGPSSDEATATVPLFNRAKITMFANSGESAFDHSRFQYFWRNTPPDDADGYALALYAHDHGYTRGATIFGNDIGSQSIVPTVTKGYTALGGSIVYNAKVALGQSSYRSEVEQMLAKHPDVIFLELDPPSASTFLAELQQLHGLLPIIGTQGTAQPAWVKAISSAIGKANVERYFVGTTGPYSRASGPAWELYNTSLLASGAQVPDAKQWSADPYSMAVYDATNTMALAMIAAHSTSPQKYNSSIIAVTAPGTGKTVVDSFAAGKQALAAGKAIQYIGPTGEAVFDQWHNSPGGFEALRYLPNGVAQPVGVLGSRRIEALAAR
ncbi:MAG: ABC transporter substrate-binding protein [Actinomycetota bacterium]|nr:ABC transporter substrate-binding protein [Actinomycetota bacterium]